MGVIAGITTSVDGYITGPNDGPGRGLGVGGERLHNWVIGGPWTYDGEHAFAMSAEDREFYDGWVADIGSGVVGRGMYDDPRPDVGDPAVVELPVLGRHGERVLPVVGPRTAHHPVVQPFAADAQATAGA